MKTSLQEIVNYSNEGVIKRYQNVYNVSEMEARLVFSDLMRFFWASEKHEFDKQSMINEEHDFVFIMDEVMRPIDEIWHIFLLYTKDYMDFCELYFGQYIHHLPDIVPNMEQTSKDFERNLRRFLNYNYELLGHQTIERWFGEKVS